MAIVAVLDPKMKMWYITFSIVKYIHLVSKALAHMFKEYVDRDGARNQK